MKISACISKSLRCSYYNSPIARNSPSHFRLRSSKASENEVEVFPLGDLNDPKLDKDTFLFGDRVTFSSCGVGPELQSALEATGKYYPTAIQAKTHGVIASGRDVIIGAETGSGKTLSYLIPIIQGLLDEAKELEGKTEESDEDAESMVPDKLCYPTAIIMVPNKELCSQVYRMANEILAQLRPQHDISIGLFTQVLDRWPYSRSQKSPQIAVCTPAFLSNFIKGPSILEEDLFRSLRQLVLDEADMLLEGSYLNDLEKVVEAFRMIRRKMIRDNEIGINDRVLQNILVAATLPSYGLRSIEKYIEKRFPLATRISNDHLHKHHPRIEQKFIKSEDELLSKLRVNLVVETIRSMTIEDDESSDDESAGVRVQQTMVFVNTADAASNLAYEIDKAGVKNAEYHKLVTDGEKQESLRRFREGEVSVLVCTDHAARGLDLPNVRHVVQAEFANNVVQYLHRIGRASRAGVLGKATNIYDRRSEDLVTSILSDTEEKKIDQSFSRRRGFRQKLKKLVRNRAGRVDEIASETSENASETSENASGTASPSPNPIGDEPLDRYF
eukprot:CAMPEP_0119035914 /NCGR_PEP_ID=MMETSP1177-20130426/3193_1 /TAXON_ID=2985 /ORGANISM="Ochromonas sp, Strain CCMP1899" /LENGTH=557 /DNA_ID=CAMNT_0006994831 /DNA_START=120 /DNA_END=1790 /DNA_ORIENTATION=-